MKKTEMKITGLGETHGDWWRRHILCYYQWAAVKDACPVTTSQSIWTPCWLNPAVLTRTTLGTMDFVSISIHKMYNITTPWPVPLLSPNIDKVYNHKTRCIFSPNQLWGPTRVFGGCLDDNDLFVWFAMNDQPLFAVTTYVYMRKLTRSHGGTTSLENVQYRPRILGRELLRFCIRCFIIELNRKNNETATLTPVVPRYKYTEEKKVHNIASIYRHTLPSKMPFFNIQGCHGVTLRQRHVPNIRLGPSPPCVRSTEKYNFLRWITQLLVLHQSRRYVLPPIQSNMTLVGVFRRLQQIGDLGSCHTSQEYMVHLKIWHD